MFRQFAQQMGLQNVRAILPEQIDLLINTSISDTVNQILTIHINSTSDRIVTDNSKLGQVNALRSIYVVKEVQLVGKPIETNGKLINRGNTLNRTIKYIDKFSVPFNKLVGGTENNIKALSEDLLSIADFSISYGKCIGDNTSPITLKNVSDYSNVECSFETNYFPVRIIDDIYLADVLNDFVLAPTLRSPAATVHDNSIDIYFGKVKNDVIDNGLIPYQFRIGYIRKPAEVKYYEDLQQNNIDCDLPENLHRDIVKHAVELWQIAVTGSLAASQAQAKRNAQQQNDN